MRMYTSSAKTKLKLHKFRWQKYKFTYEQRNKNITHAQLQYNMLTG